MANRKTAEEIIKLYISDLKNLVGDSPAQSNRLAMLEEQLEAYASQPSPQESGRETVYRKVSVKERLPELGQHVCTIIEIDGIGERPFANFLLDYKGKKVWDNYNHSVIYWLEEIESSPSDKGGVELSSSIVDEYKSWKEKEGWRKSGTRENYYVNIHEGRSPIHSSDLHEIWKRGLSTLRSTIESGKGIDKEELLKSIFMAGRRSIISSKSPDGSVEWEDFKRHNFPSPQEQDGQVAVSNIDPVNFAEWFKKEKWNRITDQKSEKYNLYYRAVPRLAECSYFTQQEIRQLFLKEDKHK